MSHPYTLSQQSQKRLQGIRPELDAVVRRAIELTTIDFMVVEGLRTAERQRELLLAGNTRTLKSKHLTGHAVDLAPLVNGKIPWDDRAAFVLVSRAVFAAAEELGVRIRWGADWDRDGITVDKDPDESFYDGPHYELV